MAVVVHRRPRQGLASQRRLMLCARHTVCAHVLITGAAPDTARKQIRRCYWRHCHQHCPKHSSQIPAWILALPLAMPVSYIQGNAWDLFPRNAAGTATGNASGNACQIYPGHFLDNNHCPRHRSQELVSTNFPCAGLDIGHKHCRRRSRQHFRRP